MIKQEFFCNKCGKQLDIFDIQEHFSLSGKLGYGSSYDGEDYEIDLCCDCMDELFESCVIPPIECMKDDEEWTD